MDSDLGPSTELEEASVLASDRGAGSLGFVGTVHKDTAAEAAGLATVSGNGFGWGTKYADGAGHLGTGRAGGGGGAQLSVRV